MAVSTQSDCIEIFDTTLRDGGQTEGISYSVDDKLRDGFRRVLGRTPSRAELQPLVTMYRHALATYTRDPAAAQQLLTVGESPTDGKIPAPELAANATVAQALLNFDESVMRR